MLRSAIILVLCLAVAISPSQAQTTNCAAAGALVCDTDCKNLVVCLGQDEGFREESVETCDAAAGTYCYSPARRCETRSSCDATTELPFECTTSGQFPHLTDCTKFYVCAPDDSQPTGFTAHPQSCEPNYAYNSSRGFCNLPLDHPTCLATPVPACNEVGAVGSLPENTSIYYVCKRREEQLQPVLFVCKHGGVFVDEIATCVLTNRSPLDVVYV